MNLIQDSKLLRKHKVLYFVSVSSEGDEWKYAPAGGLDQIPQAHPPKLWEHAFTPNALISLCLSSKLSEMFRVMSCNNQAKAQKLDAAWSGGWQITSLMDTPDFVRFPPHAPMFRWLLSSSLPICKRMLLFSIERQRSRSSASLPVSHPTVCEPGRTGGPA
jgi:hypothetical protein